MYHYVVYYYVCCSGKISNEIMSWKRISATLLEKLNISSDADKTSDISKSTDQFRKVGRSSFVFIEKVKDNVERQEIILLSDESTTCEEVPERSNSVNCDDITNSNIEILKRKTESNENVLTEDEVVTSDDSEIVVEDVCEDNIKRDQMMRVDELIETEKTYVNQLQHVVRYYMPLIQAEWGVPQTLTLLQPEDVFCNIKAIYKFHKKILLPALIEAGHDIKAIGNVFIQNIDSLLVLYEIYSNKKKISDKVIEEHSKFFEQKQEEYYDDFDISTYITTPLQRITRYPTFLESMVKDCQRLNNRKVIGITSKCTEISTNDDVHTLQDALESTVELLKILNKKSTLLVDCFGLKDLQVISELQGTYVRHDVFHVSDSCNQRRLMTCFLFEKSLILAVKLNQKVSADDIYKHYDRLPMKYLGYILSLDEETNYLTVWYHDNISRQYVLEGEISIKNNWIRDINLIMCQQLNNELYRDLFQQFKIFYSI